MSRAPWAVPKPERAFPTGNTTMYDTTLGWRFVNPKMAEMGYTDSLGMTAENLAQERFLLTPDEDAPDEVAFAYEVSREAQDRFALRSHEKVVALIELNEAFAAQSLAVLYEWGMDPEDERFNPNGGAIALGHSLGASGARILTTLVHEMRRRDDVRYGLATMCIGIGQGIVMVVEKPA